MQHPSMNVLVAVLATAGCALGNTVVGTRKLAAAADCSSVVAFSSMGAVFNGTDSSSPVAFSADLSDRGVGWSRHSGEFTCHCPGLYQVAFSGSGSGLTLRTRSSSEGAWSDVIGTSAEGGSHMVLLELDVGEQVAVWSHPGKLEPKTTAFSAYRLAKK